MLVSHFTYIDPADELKQGDLLEIDKELVGVLELYHPHYASHADYRYLAVLTQSCDLVRRHGNTCKARYISLAAVRPLRTVLSRALKEFQREEFERETKTCSSRGVTLLRQFYGRLLNNNESHYFYYHEEPSLGLEPCVAFLQLSIPIKADEHYKKCLESRIISLRTEFQAKIGWLVGDIYSRVGTEDWVPNQIDSKEFEAKIDAVIKELCVEIDQLSYKYIKKRNPIKLAMESGRNLDIIVEELIHEFVQEMKERPDRAAEIAAEMAGSLGVEFSLAKRLKNRLINDSKFRSLFK